MLHLFLPSPPPVAQTTASVGERSPLLFSILRFELNAEVDISSTLAWFTNISQLYQFWNLLSFTFSHQYFCQYCAASW